MKKIIWSDEAIHDYHQNINYLISQWSEDSASTFMDEVETTLELIQFTPEIVPSSDYKSIRRAVIRKQITLYYMIKEESIYLVRFWNTYQNPDSINL